MRPLTVCLNATIGGLGLALLAGCVGDITPAGSNGSPRTSGGSTNSSGGAGPGRGSGGASGTAGGVPGTGGAAGVIQTVGRRLYRRPLTTAEQTAYQTLYGKGSSLSGTRSAFAKGASLVLRAMLQSPYFLYRTELGAPKAPLSGYEMAAKLTLRQRDTTPSDSMLDAAAGPGKLDTADGAATQATAMLGESAAGDIYRGFHAELYHFDRYALISKVGVSAYDSSLNTELSDVS